MKKFIQKLFPGRSLQAIMTVLAVNVAAYYVPKLFVVGDYHMMGNAIDRKIPFIPVFILIYYAAFIQWVVNYIVVAHQDWAFIKRYLLAEVFSLVIAMLFFVFYPSTMDRGEVELTGILGLMTKFIYAIDSPTNLFPSLHVSRSFMCGWVAVKGKGISKTYKIVEVILTALVCASIVFVKQHVLVDIPAGLLLAMLSLHMGKMVFDKIDNKEKHL